MLRFSNKTHCAYLATNKPHFLLTISLNFPYQLQN